MVKHPRVMEAYEYWLKLKGTRRFPARADLDPVDIPRLLPGVLLLDVLRPADPTAEAIDFRYRLIGQDAIERAGVNLTGRTVRERAMSIAIPGIDIDQDMAYRSYLGVIETGLPSFREGKGRMHGKPMEFSRVHCPLSSDGELVDMIFSCVGFTGL